jgi:predicted ATPase/Tfp pilus assembly protein PilF
MGMQIAQRYTVEKLVGEGAMGEVYRGKDKQTGQTIAIKALKTSVATPELIQRFIREGEALRQLNHPNIVKVLGTHEESSRHFIILEYVGGGSLKDLLLSTPKLPVQQVLRIGLELADALTRAHLLDIVHRDIKPANVLLAEDGTPRLSDFGIAQVNDGQQMTMTGAMVGTIDYLSPESCQGLPLDPRADIWSFGVMLYQMLAGELPFHADTIATIIYNIMNNPAPDLRALRPDVPEDLADLIERMLTKNRDQRISSVRQVGADIEAILRGEKTSSHGTRLAAALQVQSRQDTPTTTLGAYFSTHNLPVQSTPFVGRADELAAIQARLNDPDCRLLTLLGPGGMGKTRLSVEVGQRLWEYEGEKFPDGVFFVALAPLTKKEEIIPAIAEATQFNFFGSEAPELQLANFLREKQMLLILDNFEHLIKCAPLISTLLEAAPKLKVLATSRERLNLHGESIFNVEGMSFPDYKTPEELAQFGAIQLFLQSARRAQAGFRLTAENQEQVVEIVQMAQGMPLGIELAAAWLEMLGPDEIVAEMRRNLDFLETELQDVPERHRSIRAVFDYSWNLMTEDERSAFSKLSVFRGGFTREAASSVTGALLRPLTMLVNKSLLRRLPSGRYEVHELLRQYAEEKLRQNQAVLVVTNCSHCEYYLEWLAKLLASPSSFIEKVAAIDEELDNIRRALDCALEDRSGGALLNITDFLLYYETRALYDEANAFCEKVCQTFRDDPDHSRLYRIVSSFYGQILIRQARYEDSLRVLQENLALARAANDPIDEAISLTWLSYRAMNLGDYNEALALGDQSYALFKSLGDNPRLAVIPNHLGYICYLMGDMTRARQIIEEGGQLSRQGNNIFLYGFNRNNLGEVLRAVGEIKRSKELFEEAYQIFADMNYIRGMAFTLNNIGGLNHGLGALKAAEDMYRRSYRLNKQIGDRTGIGHSLSALANLAYLQARYEDTLDLFRQAYQVRQEVQDRRGMAESLSDLGWASVQVNDLAGAEAYLDQSLAISQEIGDPIGAGSTLIYKANIHMLRGDIEGAYQLLNGLLGETLGMGQNNYVVGWSVLSASFVQILRGQYDFAIEMGEKMLERVQQIDFRWIYAWCTAVLGLAYFRAGQTAKAQALFLESLEIALDTQNIDVIQMSSAVMGEILLRDQKAATAYRLLYLALDQRKMPQEPMLTVYSRDLLPRVKAALTASEMSQIEIEAASQNLSEVAQGVLKDYTGVGV